MDKKEIVGLDEVEGSLQASPVEVPPLPVEGQSTRNEFTTRKTAAQAVMDTALLMANISQLRMLLASERNETNFYLPLVFLISFSIVCQVLFALFVLVIWVRESRHCTKAERRTCAPRALLQNAIMPLNTNGTASKKDVGSNSPLPQHVPQHLYTTSPGILNGRMVRVDIADDTAEADEAYDIITQKIHVATLILVFLITVTNMFITGLGFEPLRSHDTKHESV